MGADLGRLVDLEFRDPLDAIMDFPPPTLPPLAKDFNAFDGLEAFDALEAFWRFGRYRGFTVAHRPLLAKGNNAKI